jgi:hypothetical protein
LNEARSLAVIEEIVKLAPGKPIRWLISSHPHFDHIGGLRTYLHIGATIVAHQKAIGFLNRDVLNYRARTINPTSLRCGRRPELVGGLQLRGDQRELRHHRQQPHPARSTTCSRSRTWPGCLMAYPSGERIAFEAICFDTPRAAARRRRRRRAQPSSTRRGA